MGESCGGTGGSVESELCQFDDHDLLVSVFMKKRTSRSTSECSSQDSKCIRKRMSPRGSSRSQLGSLKTGPKQSRKRNWSTCGPRTVLSWLIHSGVVSMNEVIQFRSPNNEVVLKEALVTSEGLLCICCNEMLSISEFENHAGSKSKRPGMNLVMESGKPLALCQLEAWSEEYKARKAPVETSEVDEGDDLCGFCGYEGELVLCDNCPATFHQACLFEQLPEGNWYCLQCRCLTCWDVVNDKDPSLSPGSLKCSVCNHRYHETCMKGKDVNIGLTSDNWFCRQSCHEIYKGLQSRIGLRDHLSDDICWRLLQCINGDHKAHSSQDFVALKAECNSKLAVAITLLEKYFVEMVDKKTKIDMIPQAIYNWGSQFTRLNFEGFYTVVLEKKDVVVAVASIRIHGIQVAELPFIATCSKFRGQGMCRLLVCCIEQMLKSLKVEKLVLPASSDKLVKLWMTKFGFQHMKEDEGKSLRKINLMLLPNSKWLVRPL
ncbi:hypothetical protein Pfo_012135 [Paulownia fortunei]|nr:hypothetical protein Pfo_012135 [Paulownia fortunei]